MIGLENSLPQSIDQAGHEFVKALINHHSQDRFEVTEDTDERAPSSRESACADIKSIARPMAVVKAVALAGCERADLVQFARTKTEVGPGSNKPATEAGSGRAGNA